MTGYELISLLIALLSVMIAVTSLVRTRKVAEEQRKIAEEQLRLEKVTAELAAKQISQIETAEREKALPKLHVELTKLGKDYRFLIANRGQGSAFNVSFELVDCPDSPVSERELSEKFPYPELRSQSRVRLLAGIHMGSPRTYVVRLSWSDANGTEYTEDFHVSL